MSATAEAVPAFIRLLLDDSVHTVLMAGCGGGFDFCHAVNFLPMLAAAGKRVVIHSYSFGDPSLIHGSAPFTYDALPEIVRAKVADDAEKSQWPSHGASASAWPEVRVVNAHCAGTLHYAPECQLMSFLELKADTIFAGNLCSAYGDLPEELQQQLPRTMYAQPRRDAQDPPIQSTIPFVTVAANDVSAAVAAGAGEDAAPAGERRQQQRAPRFMCYASHARHWTPAALRHFYDVLIHLHSVDAVWIIDGGSDSLMKGDEAHCEYGWSETLAPGDQIEDSTSIAAVATLPADSRCRIRIVTAVGFTVDRFMGCSDEDSFRAVAELTRASREPCCDVERRVANVVADASVAEHSGTATTTTTAAEAKQLRIAGFLGVHALIRGSVAATTYSDFVTFAQERMNFRSVIANSIVASAEGLFGDGASASADLAMRVRIGELSLSPLMSWAMSFDARLMFERSLLCCRLLPCKTVAEMYGAQRQQRAEVEAKKSVGTPSKANNRVAGE